MLPKVESGPGFSEEARLCNHKDGLTMPSPAVHGLRLQGNGKLINTRTNPSVRGSQDTREHRDSKEIILVLNKL